MVTEKPVSLGAPAYKRLWPEAIWPGELPGGVPLALNIKFAWVNTSTLNPDGTVTSVKNDLQFPQEANIFGAGTLGDHVSFFGEVTFGENPDSSVSVELEHARLNFDSPFGPEDAFHIRIGKFAPNLVDGIQEMWIVTDAAIDSLFAYNPIGPAGGTGLAGDMSPMPISLPDRVRGIEAYGSCSTVSCGSRGWPTGYPGPERRLRREQRQGLLRALRFQAGRHGTRRRPGRQGAPGPELA